MRSYSDSDVYEIIQSRITGGRNITCNGEKVSQDYFNNIPMQIQKYN